MPDPAGLDRIEVEAFATVVFVAKIITWTALLIMSAIVEAGLVRRLFHLEFGKRKKPDDGHRRRGRMIPIRSRYIKASAPGASSATVSTRRS